MPNRRRRPWSAIVVSVALHALLAVFGWVGGREPTVPRRPPQMIVLAPPGDDERAVEMNYRTEPGAPRMPARGTRPVSPPLPPARAAAPELDRTPPVPADTGGPPVPRPSRPAIGRIGPGLAEGRLWVRPLPLPPKELAARLKKNHAQLVDSAVTAIVQGYLDSLASDPAARTVGLPSWTAEVAGKKFGLDSKNIYIAGLKIPAAVLALLPIPAGNIDQNRAYNHLMGLRADLQQAARRADNLEEFKVRIREMRLRKEREREFEAAQRTAPPKDEQTAAGHNEP
ncbi:MAG: hypothetical protein ACR2HK_14705 [Gemmatimonadales bacterium]